MGMCNRYFYDCIYQCGDEECTKCFHRGIIFECPDDCKDYKSQYNPEEVRKEKDGKQNAPV